MKFKLFILSLSLFTLLSCKKEETVTLECLPSNLQNGLIAFYPFNSGSLKDESTQNNDLTNSTAAAPAADRLGNATCAYGFSNATGTVQFLNTTQTSFLNNLPAFSVSMWYQPGLPLPLGGFEFETMLGRDSVPIHCPDRTGQWSVALYDCRKAVFGHDNSVWAQRVTGISQSCEDEINALTGLWHHVVAVKNGSMYSIYFDGSLSNQQTGPAGCTGGPISAQDIGDLFVGYHFTGMIDDILIFNRALSAQDVTDLFNLTACCE